MFTFCARRYKRAGGAFNLSRGVIDLENGDISKHYLTVLPISPSWGTAKIDIIEEVGEKRINFIITDDFNHTHVLTIDIDNNTKELLTSQLKDLFNSTLTIIYKTKY